MNYPHSPGVEAILLDVDGVLADFVSGVCRLFGADPDAVYNNPGMCWDFFKVLGGEAKVTEADFTAAVDRAGADFWAGLSPYPHARALYDFCASLGPVYFCTAAMPTDGSAAGKERWLKEFTGRRDVMDDAHVCKAKHLLAGPGRLLIDDKEENCRDFTFDRRGNPTGGSAILYPRPWNRRRAEDDGRAHLRVMGEVHEWVTRRANPVV